MNHYTYKITNVKTNKSYIGVRTSKELPFEDIGIKYFSSSTDKDFISEQKNYPENFIYEVINTFDNRTDALTDEVRLHDIYDVCKNPQFYNLSKQTSNGMDFTGGNHSEESKLKIGEASKKRGISEKAKDNLKWHRENRVRTQEERDKMSKAKLGNSNAAGKRSEEARKNISEGKKGKPSNFAGKTHTKKTKDKMSNAKLGDNNPKYWKGKKRDEETKSKISKSRKGKNTGPVKKIKCPHCEKIGGINTMYRWHFDKCKNKIK